MRLKIRMEYFDTKQKALNRMKEIKLGYLFRYLDRLDFYRELSKELALT